MATIYIIVETNFEYDDNYYNPTEGGRAVVAYRNKETAERELLTHNIAFLERGLSIYIREPEYDLPLEWLKEDHGINLMPEGEDYLEDHHFKPVIAKCKKDKKFAKEFFERMDVTFFSLSKVELTSV